MSITSKEMAKIACKALDDKKASDIRIIDISGISVLADYFIIADGASQKPCAMPWTRSFSRRACR